jgi:hypothetical protein
VSSADVATPLSRTPAAAGDAHSMLELSILLNALWQSQATHPIWRKVLGRAACGWRGALKQLPYGKRARAFEWPW